MLSVFIDAPCLSAPVDSTGCTSFYMGVSRKTGSCGAAVFLFAVDSFVVVVAGFVVSLLVVCFFFFDFFRSCLLCRNIFLVV